MYYVNSLTKIFFYFLLSVGTEIVLWLEIKICRNNSELDQIFLDNVTPKKFYKNYTSNYKVKLQRDATIS